MHASPSSSSAEGGASGAEAAQDDDPAGRTTEALADAAREHGVVVIGSLFERRGAGVYHNTAVIVDADGSLAGTSQP